MLQLFVTVCLLLFPYFIGYYAGQYDAKRAARHKPVSLKETVIDGSGTD